MRLLTLFLIWSLYTTYQISKDSPGNKIIWSKERQLTWSDFQAKPDSLIKDGEDASTSTQIAISLENKKNKFIFNVQCYFERDKSWTVTNTSPYLLKHEQLHFDIAEIYARSLRKDLQEMKDIQNNEVEAKIKALYHKTITACILFQKKYDSETNHSKNITKQQIWNERVNGILAETNIYNSTNVVVIKK